jgi:hypothetical protein
MALRKITHRLDSNFFRQKLFSIVDLPHGLAAAGCNLHSHPTQVYSVDAPKLKYIAKGKGDKP